MPRIEPGTLGEKQEYRPPLTAVLRIIFLHVAHFIFLFQAQFSNLQPAVGQLGQRGVLLEVGLRVHAVAGREGLEQPPEVHRHLDESNSFCLEEEVCDNRRPSVSHLEKNSLKFSVVVVFDLESTKRTLTVEML